MTPEERSLLERTYKMAEENNEILRKIRRGNRWSMAIKGAYWIVIIGLSVGAFYFIQPYVEFMANTLGIGGQQEEESSGTMQSTIDNLQELFK